MRLTRTNSRKRRRADCGWRSGNRSATPREAAAFIKEVGIALRYNATPSLPLAAMHKAAGDVRRSSELTNALLANGEAIESNVVGDRLVLIHRSLAPAILALRRRFRKAKLPDNAERALGVIADDGHASSGDVRRFLGVYGQDRPDPGDAALADLQREMLIDRGPSSIPKKGIPYLSPEGYPYRIFENAHPDVVRAAAKLSPEKAAAILIETYLRAALFVTPRKLAAIFRLLFSEDEMNAAIEDLTARNKVERTKKYVMAAGHSQIKESA